MEPSVTEAPPASEHAPEGQELLGRGLQADRRPGHPHFTPRACRRAARLLGPGPSAPPRVHVRSPGRRPRPPGAALAAAASNSGTVGEWGAGGAGAHCRRSASVIRAAGRCARPAGPWPRRALPAGARSCAARGRASKSSVAYSSAPGSRPGSSWDTRVEVRQRGAPLHGRVRHLHQGGAQAGQLQGRRPHRHGGRRRRRAMRPLADVFARGRAPRRGARRARPGWPAAPSTTSRTRPSSSRKVGSPDRSVRSGDRVGHVADQRLQLGTGAVADGRAHDDVLLAGVAGQQRLQRGQQGS